MTEINFQPVFDYIDALETKIDPLVERIDDLGHKFDNLQSAVDKSLTDLRNINEEKVITAYRTKRLEEWAKPVGEKVEVPFEV